MLATTLIILTVPSQAFGWDISEARRPFMESESGIPITALVNAGFSEGDIKFIFEQTKKFKQSWELQDFQGIPNTVQQEIIGIAINSFESGIALGIGKARNLRNAEKKFGFAL
jgi:uncharacterized SAM-binding protein YcdF (DUF218 family)